ncbi:hypothetical protein L6452_37349 [Arctium lappa]|uniref:Uncharacterized protein n=1 Tax=Arctium lappa TaxID=4217 RepID=A0ACB8Y2T3_ARCLA|nr:hypothetical protein L6452_37349 [Arctium lappa]
MGEFVKYHELEVISLQRDNNSEQSIGYLRPEDLAISTRSETVHSTRLQIHEHYSWNKPSTTSLVVVNIDPLKLEFSVSGIHSRDIDVVLRSHNIPELGSDLITALAALNMKNLTHFQKRLKEKKKRREVREKRQFQNL